MLTKVSTDKAPAAIGPYSQGIIANTANVLRVPVNSILFTSGQIPINPETGEMVEGDIKLQAEQVMKNIGEILKEAGTDFKNVVKTTCFLAEMSDFAAFNSVYEKYFNDNSALAGKPARSCVAVKELPKNALCEVEVIALVKG